MFKYVEKHWKGCLIAIVLVTLAVLAGSMWRKYQAKTNSTDTKLPVDTLRSGEAYTDTYYFDQLNDSEENCYEVLKQTLDTFQGGIIEFPEELTGEEYTRVTHALQYGAQDYFYGIIGIPMTDDNRCVNYDSDVLEVKDSIIKKCVLFLSCAKNVDLKGEFDEEGYVTNLDEAQAELGTSSEDAIKEIQEEQVQVDVKLAEIVDGMPKEYGEKEAVDYFVDWMDQNLDSSQEGESIDDMSVFFENVYKRNGVSCLIDKKVSTSGYNKVLSTLCNRVGIQSHVALGQWKKDGKAYVMTYVNIDGQDIYVDASREKSKDLWDQKYLTRQETENAMQMAGYINE